MQAANRNVMRERSDASASRTTLRIERMLIDDYPALIAMVSRRCGTYAEAADLLQEAIRIAIEHHARGSIADVRGLPGYVFRTAISLLRNHNRALENRTEFRASEGDRVACQDAL